MDNEEAVGRGFIIPVEELFPKFEKHLITKDNSRILFSGKFGIGKTYFLNEFFEDKKEEFEVFHLFPVNYQITSNENIIEFLKYDILIELLKKNKEIIQKEDYGNLVDLQRLLYLWGKDNFKEIFKTGISLIPKLGKPLKDIMGLTENFWKFKKEIEAGEQDFVDRFLKEIKKKNISETDPLSELLNQKINKQKSGKQSVLILDDLERIDPEHIFRIFNVFSAHLDLDNNEVPNKFNFDKIILVADVKNLQSIFHYRYGEKTDFNGYLNKFFSIEVFQFKNEEIISKAVDKIILKFKNEDTELSGAMGNSGYLKLFLEDILKKSLELPGKEKLDLRQLFKGIKFTLPAFKQGSYQRNGMHSDAVQGRLPFVNIGIEALTSIFNGLENDFLSVLQKIKQNLNIKKENNADRIYSKFSHSLLVKISPQENYENSVSGWSDYKITYKDNAITQIRQQKNPSIGAINVNGVFLFYDLLIEYVKTELYKQKIYDYS